MRAAPLRLKLYLVAVIVTLVSFTCFAVQGGFGGGHGSLDRIIFVLALPWALIEWPGFVMAQDLVWLILVPFALNLAAIFLLTALSGALGRARLGTK
jgi:hypothetical protein